MSEDSHWSHVVLLALNEGAPADSFFAWRDQSSRLHTLQSFFSGDNAAQPIWAMPPEGPQTCARFTTIPVGTTEGHTQSGWVSAQITDDSLEFGTGDFCIEGFFRPIPDAGGGPGLYTAITDDSVFRIRVVETPPTGFRHQVSLTSVGIINENMQAGTFYHGGWNHIAFYRIGNLFYGALNGAVTQVGNSAGSVTLGSVLTIGSDPSNNNTQGFNGFAASVRVTKGEARYPAEHFQENVPTWPFPTSGIRPPIVVCATSGQVEEPFDYQIQATNEPGSFTASALPPGLFLNVTTGAITGTPTEAGTFEVQVNAANDAGQNVCHATILITIHPVPPPPPPEITSELEVTAEQGQEFEYQITTEGGHPPFTFGAIEMPPELSIDPETGIISGMMVADPGTYHTTITATDENGTTTATLVINVEPARPPLGIPVITSPDTASGTVGNPFVYVVTARNVPTSFYATGLPDGLSINTQTGTITGSPREMGTFHVTLSATNKDGTGTMTLVLSVAPTPIEKPCPPPPPRPNLSGPDVPQIACYVPDGCCGPDICELDLWTFICQIRSLLPEGEIFNNTRKTQGEPPKNVGTITIGCSRIGCEQLIFGGCCDDQIFCDDDPISPQLAVVDSYAAVAFQMIEALCRMLPELDPCTSDQFVEKWAERMGITRRTKEYDPCGPEFSYKVLAFLICFVLQLRYNRQRAVNWAFLEMVANRMGAAIKLRYAGDLNGVANTDEEYLSGWWSMARDAPVCPPRDPCPPDPRAELGAFFDRRLGGQALDPVGCAPPNENSPLSLNVIICPSDIIVPENCNLPLEMQRSPLPHDAELYDAFWWLLPQLLPRGPLWCLYECCPADCVV